MLVVVTVIALFAQSTSASHPSGSNAATGVALAPTPAPKQTRAAAPASTRSTVPSPSTHHPSTHSPPTHSSPTDAATRKVTVEATGGGEQLAADALPPGAVYTARGTGTFSTISGTSEVFGHGPLRTFDIQVEQGITGVDSASFAGKVVQTLSDKRSWTGDGSFSLQRVTSAAKADFHVALTSPMTLRSPCDYQLKIETSCWGNQHGEHRVYLNLARWVRGDTQFAQDLPTYRLYMINHEVGHALGHQHTYSCLPSGLAPVMMQQTITLKERQGTGPRICQPNVWPFPPGVDPKVAVPS